MQVPGEDDTAAAVGDTDRPLEGKKRGSLSYDDNSELKKVKSVKKRHSKKSKHRRRSYDSDDDPPSNSASNRTSSDDSSEYRRDRRKRRKKEHRKSKKTKKERKKEKKEPCKRDFGKEKILDDVDNFDGLERNHALANELCNLFERHPSFSNDLPIMLIRLGSGATFDLRSMTDRDAALGLVKVLKCLHPFGVLSNEDETIWSWKNPARAHGSKSSNDLVLIRLVRALLDQIGITIEAVEQYENPGPRDAANASDRELATSVSASKSGLSPLVHKVKELLQTFGSDLAADLAGLCKMILEGECVNLDALPNEQLKEALESLFDLCGLERLEIDVDGDETDTDVALGYGLPESQAENANSKEYVSHLLDACHANSLQAECRSIQGPMLNPAVYHEVELPNLNYHSDTSDDDDGPMQLGFAAKAREATLTKEHIKASASRRAHELACAKQGIKIDSLSSGNVREEWMVVPGKFDFFDSIKSGQPIRSRMFEGKSKAESSNRQEPIDPKVQAEIRAIREAYEDSRGPSLMDQHRDTIKQRHAQEKSAGKNSSSWKWDRDKDLDAGRRVDKEALGMILGGAGSDLKKKFQSGH
jgi:Protein of unknown function (DUF3752)